MSTRERIIRQNKIELNLHLTQYWQTFVSYIPEVLKNPLQLLTISLQIINMALEVGLFLVLLAQTAHVLSNSEKRYINLRHLLIKWMTLIIMLAMEQHIKNHTSHKQLFALFINVLSLLMVYPSKFIKNLHLKYFSFSERKKYDDSEEDPSNYEMTITTRMLVSITLFFLNSSRFIITFVPLHHRKKIEESMKGVNMVIVEEKYFWKMYESAWSNPNPNSTQSNAKVMNKNESAKDIRTASQSKIVNRENILRSKVGEYIEIIVNTGIDLKNRKFTFYRNVQLIYNIETSQLTLVGQQDNKSVQHILQQIAVVQDNMLHLMCFEEDEPIFVKFKVKKEMELFVNAISMEEGDISYRIIK